jgi:hypothetical protein
MGPGWRRGLTRAGALLLVAAVAASCASPSPRARVRRAIVGGTEAPDGAYPETVALVDLTYGDPTSYFCTGTLIAPDLVLSAAHCLFDWHDRRMADADLGVYLGHDARSVPLADVIRVSKSFVPDTYPYGEVTDTTYGLGRDDDISLLVLAEGVTGVTPAPILDPARLPDLTQGRLLLLVGYGATTQDGSGPDGLLFFASSPVQVHSDFEIAIGAPGQPDTCFGDSGGPAFLEEAGARLLVGVTSRGTYNATIDCGEGTVNTLAPAYLEWIDRSLATLDGGFLPHDAGQADVSPGEDGGEDGGRDGPGGDDGHGGDGGHGGGCTVAPRSTAGQSGALQSPWRPLLGLLLAPFVPGRRCVPRRPRHRTPI